MIYFKLFLCALIPVALSVGFYWLKKATPFGKLKETVQQIIIGVVFGGAAVFGTEFGIDVGGAAANARDAAPLCAGLIFGGPAGIIAGVIGGVERFFAVYWGVAEYSRWACSISPLLAGFYAAFLRKFMFGNKRPTWGFGCATGVVMEVIHLTILFITHLSDVKLAIKIVQICGLPMIVCNAVSVTLACVFVGLSGRKTDNGEQKYRKISQQVQVWLLVCVVLAYLATTTFVYSFQTSSAKINAEDLLRINITDTLNNTDVNGNVPEQVKNLTASRAVGETGYLLIADETEAIISDETKAGDTLTSIGLKSVANESAEKNVMFESSVYGETCYVSYDVIGNKYYVVAVIPFGEVFETREASVYINSFMEVIVFAILFFMIYTLIKKLVVDKIKTVNNGLGEIIDGNLDVKIDVYSS
ncbi:MAG: hypothetical protein MJ072_03895, partial [Clostridia bacterium]|nr:hypothetical protein [Clostridia bacterium]